MTFDQLKATLDTHDALLAILSRHCGEAGDSQSGEGAVETLERLVRERGEFHDGRNAARCEARAAERDRMNLTEELRDYRKGTTQNTARLIRERDKAVCDRAAAMVTLELRTQDRDEARALVAKYAGIPRYAGLPFDAGPDLAGAVGTSNACPKPDPGADAPRSLAFELVAEIDAGAPGTFQLKDRLRS